MNKQKEIQKLYERCWTGKKSDRAIAWDRLESSVQQFAPDLLKSVRLARLLDQPIQKRSQAYISRSGHVIEIIEQFHQTPKPTKSLTKS